MAEADYRLMTEATGQRIAAALESLVNLGDPVTIAHGGTGASTASAALAALGGVAVTDIVDNLTSTLTTAPLSAAQGKALNDILSITPKIKTTTITGTTNASGNLLYSDFTGTRVIGAESTGSIVLYFLSGDYYYFKVLSWDDMSPKANFSLTITVIYY